jgi:hypothetical protein
MLIRDLLHIVSSLLSGYVCEGTRFVTISIVSCVVSRPRYHIEVSEDDSMSG